MGSRGEKVYLRVQVGREGTVMGRRIASLLGVPILVGLLLLAASPAQAQTQAQVRAEMQATEVVLEAAEKSVAATGCERGLALVERARQLQETARGASSVDSRVRLRAALARTRQALSLAKEAMRTCQVEAQAVDRIRSVLESTRQLAQRAQGELQARPSPDAERLLRAGFDQLERAESAYREEQLQLAVSYVTVARKLIERALKEVPAAADALAEPSLVEAELAETETVLSNLRAATITPRRRPLFDQAVSNQARARSSLAEGRPAQALEFTLAARRLAADLLREGDGGADGSRVVRAVEIVESSFLRLEPQLRETGDATVLDLLEKSRDALGLARSQLDEGRYGPAARAARLAGTLLRQAAETAGVR